MTVDEGGLPKGVLSDYVSGVFADRAQPKEVQLDRFTHQTAPLREYLLQLAAPLDELLSRFNVHELLEEARRIYLAKANEEGGEDLLYPGRLLKHELSEAKDKGIILYPDPSPEYEFSEYGVFETRPLIYQQVVSDPQPRESFQLKSSTVEFDTLIDPENFRSLIPKLEGYGFTLQTSWRSAAYYTESRIVEEPGYFSFNVWPGGGSAQSSPSRSKLVTNGGNIHVRMTKSLCVEADAIGSTYNLLYTHQLRRDDLRPKKFDGVHLDSIPRQDSHNLLCTPQKVYSDDKVESLCKLLGDDIVKEFEGKYRELIRRYSIMA